MPFYYCWRSNYFLVLIFLFFNFCYHVKNESNVLLPLIYLLHSEGIRVSIVGDSLAQRSQGFFLQEKLGYGYEVKDFSASGRTCLEWINDISRPLEFKPHIIIVELGTNDAMSFSNLAFQNYYNQLLQEIELRSTGKVILTKVPRTKDEGIRNTIVKNNAFIGSFDQDKYKIVDIDFEFEKYPTKDKLYPLNDNIHPSDFGNHIIGETYKSKIMKIY